METRRQRNFKWQWRQWDFKCYCYVLVLSSLCTWFSLHDWPAKCWIYLSLNNLLDSLDLQTPLQAYLPPRLELENAFFNAWRTFYFLLSYLTPVKSGLIRFQSYRVIDSKPVYEHSTTTDCRYKKSTPILHFFLRTITFYNKNILYIIWAIQ